MTLQPTTGGAFEIELTVNGLPETIYSKLQLGRFPHPDEVEKSLEERLGSPVMGGDEHD